VRKLPLLVCVSGVKVIFFSIMVSVNRKEVKFVTEINILGTLEIYRSCNMKPNFSELQRRYGIDRHTIKKYYVEGGKKPITRKRESGFEPYKDEIIQLMNKLGVTKKAVYEYLKDKYDKLPSYSQFRKYTQKQGIMLPKDTTPHVRYETKPGQQLQVDWKEGLRMISKHGEVIDFNVYSATLGHSRYHKFIYSRTKTTEDFLRCTIDTFNQLGGVPKEILTDNMSAVVSINNGSKRKHKKILQFEKDLGSNIRLCKPRSPQTKGKDESANRFLAWLKPYDGEFEDEAELIHILERINQKVNQEVNQTTYVPPCVLFEKEKEYLTPLPNNVLLDSYVENVEVQSVPQTLLVRFKGSGYSVPKQFIHKRVKLIPIDDKLYIYYSTQLIAIHTLTNKKFNYNQRHYVEALNQTIKNDELDIEQIAQENLALLDQIGGYGGYNDEQL
jgi:transposase